MKISVKERTKYKNGIRWVKADNPKLRRYIPVFEATKVKPNFNQKLFEKIKDIHNKEKSELGYITFWHLRKLGIKRVFECIKAYYLDYPYKIKFQVNRAGQITSFKLLK